MKANRSEPNHGEAIPRNGTKKYINVRHWITMRHGNLKLEAEKLTSNSTSFASKLHHFPALKFRPGVRFRLHLLRAWFAQVNS